MTLWLVEESHRYQTADRYHQGYKPQKIEPIEAVIYHYTGSTRPDPTRRWLTKKDAHYVSAHFLVDRDGSIDQMAALDERTWHAGGPSSTLFGVGNVNGRTIGIEIMNVGPLVNKGGHYLTSYGKRFGGRPVHVDTLPGKYAIWEAYEEAQIQALVSLTQQLKKLYPVLASEPDQRLIGHEHVDPTRKIDPGPAFPWERIRTA